MVVPSYVSIMTNSNRPTLPSRRALLLAGLSVLALVASLFVPLAASADPPSTAVVVANRGSGDISVIDTKTLSVGNYPLPALRGGETAEPMYVSHDSRHDRVLVGDRGSSSIVAFDDETYAVVGSVTVGDGVFHQWLEVNREQLWVVGDTSQTVSVVDSSDLSLITTIPLSADVVADGGKPHDVFVKGNNAFVSVLNLDDGSGLVIRYSTKTFNETGRIATGADPHLFVRSSKLYVASQGGHSVSRFHANTLAPLGAQPIPNAHGLFVTKRNEVFVTNIAGAGDEALWELDGRLTRVTDTADTAPTPHNLTVDNRRQLWVTHSGATANQVSVVELTRAGFGASSSVAVGTNPFGLAFVG